MKDSAVNSWSAVWQQITQVIWACRRKAAGQVVTLFNLEGIASKDGPIAQLARAHD